MHVDLQVVAIKSHYEAVLENAGGRDVFVACINFESPFGKETWAINKVVRAGQFEVVSGPASRDGIDWRADKNGEFADKVKYEGQNTFVPLSHSQWPILDQSKLRKQRPSSRPAIAKRQLAMRLRRKCVQRMR